MLYERNLISEPEVNAKMNEVLLRISREKVPADSVMPEFYAWLDQWASDHPDRVAAARLAGGAYSPEAVRERARTDSVQKAQADSARRASRERHRDLESRHAAH